MALLSSPTYQHSRKKKRRCKCRWPIFFVLTLFLAFNASYYLLLKKFSALPVTSTGIEQLAEDDFTIIAGNESLKDAPNVIHFVIGLDSAGATKPLQFFFYQYLAIKAAKIYAKPDAVYLHYYYKPVGHWFEKALFYVDKLRKIDTLPTHIYGNYLKGFAHRADVFRLLTLRKYGGIFIDMDMIALRPLNDLLRYDLVLGQEGEDAYYGLLMSFTVAKKTSFFLKKWIQAYKTFDGKIWNYHCCQVPKHLAKQFPSDIHILDHRAIAWPLWHHYGIKEAFLERTYGYETNYVTHLWETTTRLFLRNLTAHKIWTLDTSLFCLLRNLTKDEPGAGVFGEETEKNCELVKKASRKDDGLVGRWEFRNLHSTLPKIPDSSGNRMHGLLSPLNSYDAVNPVVFSQALNFLPLRRDHVYLPIAPDTSTENFTFLFWLRLSPKNKHIDSLSRRWVILSVEFDFPAHEIMLNLETFDGKTLFLTIERAENYQVEDREAFPTGLEPNKWYRIAIISRNGFYSLQIHVDGNQMCLSTLQIAPREKGKWKNEPVPLKGIWLGRRAVTLLHSYFAFEHETDAYCDFYDFQFYDNAFNDDQLCEKVDEPFIPVINNI